MGEKESKISPVKAWIGYTLGFDPTKLKLESGNERGKLRYNYNLANELINLEVSDLYIRIFKKGSSGFEMGARHYPHGFGHRDFLAFKNGYTGEGERPGFWHPILRKCYDEGIKARNKTDWKDEGIVKISWREEDEEYDGRSRPFYSYRQYLF